MHRESRAGTAAVLAFITWAPLFGCGSRETAAPPSTSPSVAEPEIAAATDDAPTEHPQLAPTAGANECAEDGVAARAVRVTLAHAERQGVPHAHLADCLFEAAHCGAERPEPTEEVYGSRCVVDARTTSGTFQIRVQPEARQGAPRWIDASLDANATAPPARLYVGASTWAVGANPSVVVGGIDGHISHGHGGEPAYIDHAQLSIRDGSTAPLRVTARRVEWLTSASCEVPHEVRAEPHIAGLTIAGSDAQTRDVLVAPSATSAVTVWFAPQPAYYSYCDRFAARVTLDVNGEAIVAVAEWEVARREPIRRQAP